MTVQKNKDQNILISTNPSRNYEILGEVEVSSESEIQSKVDKARKAQKSWSEVGLDKRIKVMRSLHDHLAKHKDEFVTRQSKEMGMPNGLSTSILDGFLSDMLWHCDHASDCLANEILYEDQNEINEIVYEPYGVVACIAAWNFPFGNLICSLSQALLAGNTAVMKYSEEVPLFSKYLEEVVASSDLPKGVLNFVYGDGQVGRLLADQDIDFLTFTGSSAVGQKLYQKAAEKFIPISLELGGSSPGIVFEDCTIDDALIETLFWKRFLNSAQFCDGMKRLIVHNNLIDEVVKKLSDYAKTKVIGDPLDEKTELGPLVAERQVVKLEEQVKDAIDKGAILHCGGQRPEGLKGAYYQPTIFTNITKDMRVWKEEVFGPALPIIGFDTYEEAIELANDTSYGLSGSVFTNDKNLARRAQLDIKAGNLDHNKAHFFRPQNPFGGYKASGIGRQSGKAGFEEVTQIKVVATEKSD
ncbi:MAG: aldehyde dehydrogenase family protein [Pseudomonadota bacterium]